MCLGASGCRTLSCWPCCGVPRSCSWREGAHEFGAFPTAWVRVTLAALILSPVLIWRREVPLLVQHWREVLSAGLLNAGIPFACYAYALMHINTGLTSILNATTPLFGALIAWLWLGDKLNATRALGLALGFTGVVLLASDVPRWNFVQTRRLWLGRRRLFGCHLLLRHFWQFHQALFTECALLGHDHWQPVGRKLGLGIPAFSTWPSAAPSLHAWAALGIAGLLCTALAYVLFFRLMARTGPARAMTVTYLIPVFANLFGVIFLDEVVTHWMMGCAVVIVAGTALASGLIQRQETHQK